MVFLLAARSSGSAELNTSPAAEFHMARMVYTSGNAGRSWRPWWAIDYPDAEYHFTRGLRRLTTLAYRFAVNYVIYAMTH